MNYVSSLEIQASGIKCEGCVSNIENGLNQLAGITTVKVDRASNVVTVEGENLDKAVITEKLAELGYPAI